jgi:RNA polymerase sigma-70 factor (sigma-E family)
VQEPEGFRSFVESRYPALVRFGTLLTADQGRGEDLVQEALVKTLRAWRRLHPDGNPEAYTRTVMTHASWRAARRLWRGEQPAGDLPERAGPDVYREVDTADAVRRALAGLPAQQRVVLVLRYWDHLSEAEIAARLGVSAGTVKSRASRALAHLRGSGLLADAVGGEA